MTETNYDPANLTPTGELIYTDFVDVPELLGCDTAAEYEAECNLLDDCYTRGCRGTPYTIWARPPYGGEAAGAYAVTGNDLQILGGSIPVPEDVAEIMRAAWEEYCAMPRDDE